MFSVYTAKTGAAIGTLSNGDFSTNDSASHNRYDATVNEALVLDLGEIKDVHTLQVAAGNAVRGGTEMPRDMHLCRYVGSGADAAAVCADAGTSERWESITTAISYAAPNGVNDRAAAETQTFVLPPSSSNCGARFFRLVAVSNWGNRDGVVFRQLALEGDAATRAKLAPITQLLGSAEWAPIKKNTLVGTICTAVDYEVSFDLKLLGAVGGYGSIVHFTATAKNGIFNGCRIPGIWTNPSATTLLVVAGHQANHNPCATTSRALHNGEEVTVRVRVQGTALTVWFGDEKVHEGQMGARQSYDNAKVYVGDPWYEPANAELRNLRYTPLLPLKE